MLELTFWGGVVVPGDEWAGSFAGSGVDASNGAAVDGCRGRVDGGWLGCWLCDDGVMWLTWAGLPFLAFLSLALG